MCKKARKLHTLSRVSRFMNPDNLRVIMKAFIDKIKRIALRIVFNHNATFEELLNLDNSVTIYERNIQALAIELFKVIKGFTPPSMDEIFPLKDSLSCYSRFPFKTCMICTINYGSETLVFLGPKIWNIVPVDCKNPATMRF